MLLFVLAVVILPHLLAGLTTIVWWRWTHHRGLALFVHTLGALSLTYLSVTLLPWCYTSVYFPFLYIILWLTLLLFTAWKKSTTPNTGQLRWHKFLAVSVVVLFSGIHYWQQQPPSITVDWPLPLQGKGYYIQQGGHSWLTNPFHHRYYSQSQAVDIVRLNTWGNRAQGILPSQLNSYTIYGDTVYSPIAGQVLRARNDRPEPTPPIMDASVPLGNHVIIQKGDTLVLLGHMIPGSVQVKTGDWVDIGTPLGNVGNSGRSSEPHLHYQVVLQTDAGWQPIGIRWQGRYPSTGDKL